LQTQFLQLAAPTTTDKHNKRCQKATGKRFGKCRSLFDIGVRNLSIFLLLPSKLSPYFSAEIPKKK